MLIVLMVLLMTTATATYAVHSTMMEMRHAGYNRQSVQTSLVGEGTVYAGIGYVDQEGAAAFILQRDATTVEAGSELVPGTTGLGRVTNMVRIVADDFQAAGTVASHSPPVEMEGVPSLGPRTVYAPSFMIDSTDIHETRVQVAGNAQDGSGFMNYYMANMTSRATLSVAGDATLSGDTRGLHETVSHARAMVLIGPTGQ